MRIKIMLKNSKGMACCQIEQAELFSATPADFKPILIIATLNPTNVVSIGISSTIGLAVLLSIKANLSFAVLLFYESDRVIEPAPTTLKPQSIKVTGINA